MNAGTQGQIHEKRGNLTYLLQTHIGINNKKNPLPEYEGANTYLVQGNRI